MKEKFKNELPNKSPLFPAVKTRFDKQKEFIADMNTLENKKSIISSLLIQDNYLLAEKIYGEELGDILLSSDFLPQTFLYAVENGALNTLESLSRKYEKALNANNHFIETLSHIIKCPKVAKIIISNMNLLSSNGKNLLHGAVLICNLELVKFIVKNKPVLISQVDNAGASPLDYAYNLSFKIFMKQKHGSYVAKQHVQTISTIMETLIKPVGKLDVTDNLQKLIEKRMKQPGLSIAKLDTEFITNPGDDNPYYSLSEQARNSTLINALSTKAIYKKGYSKSDWKLVKDQLANCVEQYKISKNISPLRNAFNLFVASTEELKIENIMKHCGLSKDSPNPNDQEIKLFMLGELSVFNYEIDDHTLSLQQSQEAISSFEHTDQEALKKLSWYNKTAYKIYWSHVTVLARVGASRSKSDVIHNAKLMKYLELSQDNAPTKNSIYYITKKFILFYNMNLLGGANCKSFIDNIKEQNIKTFLNRLAKDVPKTLDEISKLTNEITDPLVKDWLTETAIDIEHDIRMQTFFVHYKKTAGMSRKNHEEGILSHCIKQKSIFYLFQLCMISDSTDIKRQAMAALSTYTSAFQAGIEPIMFQIYKAIIHYHLGNYDKSLYICLRLEENNITSTSTKNLVCNILADLTLNHGKCLTECAAKIKLIDPLNSVLKLLQPNDEEIEIGIQEEPTPIVPTSTLAKVWTKDDLLSLSEREFKRVLEEENISLGIKKAYYKKLDQHRLHLQLAKSLEKCCNKTIEKTESWIISSGKVIKSNDDNVFRVGNNIWAQIDQDLIESLQHSVREKFENSIANARPGRDHIKYIDNIVELTIIDNERLYTDRKYCNDHNSSLIIFNKFGKHPKVGREIDNAGSINKVPVLSLAEEIVTVIHSSASDATYASENPAAQKTYEHKDADLESLGQGSDWTQIECSS